MTGLVSFKNDVFSSNTCQFYKKQYFDNPVRVSLAILMQIKKKKKCFCSSFKFAVVLVRAAKKHAAGESPF